MQLQCKFSKMSFSLLLLLVVLLLFFLFPRITALKMSADVYNSLVFCVSTEADGPQQ